MQGGHFTPIDLIVEERFHRSAPGGMGGTKCAGNYSPVLVTQLAAKKQGYAGEPVAGTRADAEANSLPVLSELSRPVMSDSAA